MLFGIKSVKCGAQTCVGGFLGQVQIEHVFFCLRKLKGLAKSLGKQSLEIICTLYTSVKFHEIIRQRPCVVKLAIE